MAGSQEMMSYEVGSGSGFPEDLKGNMMREWERRRSERLPNG